MGYIEERSRIKNGVIPCLHDDFKYLGAEREEIFTAIGKESGEYASEFYSASVFVALNVIDFARQKNIWIPSGKIIDIGSAEGMSLDAMALSQMIARSNFIYEKIKHVLPTLFEKDPNRPRDLSPDSPWYGLDIIQNEVLDHTVEVVSKIKQALLEYSAIGLTDSEEFSKKDKDELYEIPGFDVTGIDYGRSESHYSQMFEKLIKPGTIQMYLDGHLKSIDNLTCFNIDHDSFPTGILAEILNLAEKGDVMNEGGKLFCTYFKDTTNKVMSGLTRSQIARNTIHTGPKGTCNLLVHGF